jgi:hypothetical protein
VTYRLTNVLLHAIQWHEQSCGEIMSARHELYPTLIFEVTENDLRALPATAQRATMSRIGRVEDTATGGLMVAPTRPETR